MAVQICFVVSEQLPNEENMFEQSAPDTRKRKPVATIRNRFSETRICLRCPQQILTNKYMFEQLRTSFLVTFNLLRQTRTNYGQHKCVSANTIILFSWRYMFGDGGTEIVGTAYVFE